MCGVDEVGRGSLAGPVYAAAFIFPDFKFKLEFELEQVNDSKKLSAKNREKIFEILKNNNAIYSIGFATVKEIDKLNILNATKLAMQRAIENLNLKPDLILVDGNFIPDFGDIKCQNIVKGDSISYSIACASIIAKVLRDKFMCDLHDKFPTYDFFNNKGYGTRKHIDIIKKIGPCIYHRKTFLKKILKNILIINKY